MKDDRATTWAEAKRAMKRKFSKDEDDWLHILEKTKQMAEEDAEQFETRIQRICKKVNPL